MVVDLHLHTNCSDGKLSVTDTIKTAHEKGISILSITDHDSLTGIKKAIQISREYGITCFSGLELSCRNENNNISFPTDISIHILAYNINYENKLLISYLKHYHLQRSQILSALIEELTVNGFDAKYDDIYVIAGSQMRIQDIINHINSTFMCKEKKERFVKIANGYYTKLFMLDTPLLKAVKLIKDAGGIPVLAHAFFSYRDYDVIKNTEHNISMLLDYLCDIGISGIEVYYAKFTKQQICWLLKEAQNRKLIITAGSDFHGTPLRREMINYEIDNINDTIQMLLDVNRYSTVMPSA